MTQRANRIHALTNTLSGVAGEARVAAEFIRCGYKIAKPYWNDDEIDLLLLHPINTGEFMPIKIQVKSVQFLKTDKSIPIQGLKKRYLCKSPNLGLAVYLPEKDDIYFVDGAEKIRGLYQDQTAQNKRRTSFDNLKDEQDVRIRVDSNSGLGSEWLVDRSTPTWLTERVKRLIASVEKTYPLAPCVEQLLGADSADEEHEE